MGLAERRAIQEFKDKSYAALKKEIDQAAGFEVPLDVQWDTMAVEGMSHMTAESLPKVYFTPVRDALKAITVDEMGKSALKSDLKKVVFANTKNAYSASDFTFEGGTLTVDHEPYTNVDDVVYRTQAIQEMLEKKL